MKTVASQCVWLHFLQSDFSYKVIKQWNKLSVSLKTCTDFLISPLRLSNQ